MITVDFQSELSLTDVLGWYIEDGRIWVQFNDPSSPVQLYRGYQSGIEKGKYQIIVDAPNDHVSDWESERYDVH